MLTDRQRDLLRRIDYEIDRCCFKINVSNKPDTILEYGRRYDMLRHRRERVCNAKAA